LRTRILPYCHTASSFIDCSGNGIANVDQAPETGAIILSFLENTSAWESIGVSNQTLYGGLYFYLENAAGTQYTPLAGVSLGSQNFQPGGSSVVDYDEFADGAGTLAATSMSNKVTNCGSFSVPGGYYSTVRCKFSPLISSVQSSLSTGLAGLTVASASTITVNGGGFSSSSGTALLANGRALSGQIDSINVYVAPPGVPPTISLSAPNFSLPIPQVAPHRLRKPFP
jgi:hypothetical protein